MAASAYNDPDYRAARAWLTANPGTPCWHHGCTRPANTIDHDPPLAIHTHRRGTRCCRYLPACTPHNCGDGAAMGNRMREPHTERW
jgi:hypothetical protein